MPVCFLFLRRLIPLVTAGDPPPGASKSGKKGKAVKVAVAVECLEVHPRALFTHTLYLIFF